MLPELHLALWCVVHDCRQSPPEGGWSRSHSSDAERVHDRQGSRLAFRFVTCWKSSGPWTTCIPLIFFILELGAGPGNSLIFFIRRGIMTKVLVIDDEEGIRSLLDTLLRLKGYDVVLAASGRKGVELFRRECPDVVVLDLNMPELGGVAVLQQIRSLNPDQRVIILTGAGTPETEQHLFALGASAFVEKEFSLHRLGDALTRILTAPQSAALANASTRTVPSPPHL
jgi:two-component system, response regulator, stage 0 sporulation protein F